MAMPGEDNVRAVGRQANDFLPFGQGHLPLGLQMTADALQGGRGRFNFVAVKSVNPPLDAGQDCGGAARADQQNGALAGGQGRLEKGHHFVFKKSRSQTRQAMSARNPGGSAGRNCSSSRTVPRL